MVYGIHLIEWLLWNLLRPILRELALLHAFHHLNRDLLTLREGWHPRNSLTILQLLSVRRHKSGMWIRLSAQMTHLSQVWCHGTLRPRKRRTRSPNLSLGFWTRGTTSCLLTRFSLLTL
jgi:hypothetical protein